MNPLLPQDPYERVMARFWAKFGGEKVIFGVWGAYAAEGEEKLKAVESAKELLDIIEKQIEGKKFFSGEKVDYLAVDWMTIWLNAMEEVGEMKLLDSNRFPSIKKWTKNFIEDPHIHGSIPPREVVVDYFQSGLNYLRFLAASKS